MANNMTDSHIYAEWRQSSPVTWGNLQIQASILLKFSKYS